MLSLLFYSIAIAPATQPAILAANVTTDAAVLAANATDTSGLYSANATGDIALAGSSQNPNATDGEVTEEARLRTGGSRNRRRGPGTSCGASCCVMGRPCSESCFGSEASMACRDLSCTVRTRMADLTAGDLVATAYGLERVVINQHKGDGQWATSLLRIETADGAAITVTPEHVIAIDGAFVPAAEAAVGRSLSTGAISKVAHLEAGPVINPITSSGTILVADVHGGAPVLSSTYPEYIAGFLLALPTFPFVGTRFLSRLAPAALQAFYERVERGVAAALPALQAAGRAQPLLALPIALAADALFSLGFLVYTLALPLAAYCYLVAARKAK